MSENVKPATEQSSTADEIDLLDVLIVLARHKKWIAGCTIGIGSAALVASLLMTPIFTSTATIMPPQQQSSGLAAMMGQLGALAGAAGGIAGLKNPNDLYVGMLQSQTVANNLVTRFKLMEKFETPTMVDTRSQLAAISNISSGKDGLISVSVDDDDPKFAAELANAYVDELIKLTQTLAVTDAAQQRLFYEKQLQATKDKLAQAEVALKRTQEKTGLLQPDGQVQAIIANVAQLKATIAAKEVEMTAMRSFATEQNPDYIRTQQEIQGLKAQLTKLEQGQPEAGDFMVPTGKVPQTGLEYVRKLRDVKYYETMFELLAKQYELAKINEAKDSSTVQVLDKATPPDRKSKPKRALIVALGLIGGLFSGLFVAFFKEQRHRAKLAGTSRWQEVAHAWRT
ncbi:GumC family protein [Vogesella alkaliphila]|uniref:Transport-related membrane protein n=1 Tax=Vogesella alkaliphila TaxID=1193621 RepID=A0ABQ2YHS8_9NEIS|nr:Wzz/FepE/Etk N-terminal domain-containing protein [Vogesella alkaliphila]GGX84131.1 transport-related membrane protein [Vogesella alkaliphila]